MATHGSYSNVMHESYCFLFIRSVFIGAIITGIRQKKKLSERDRHSTQSVTQTHNNDVQMVQQGSKMHECLSTDSVPTLNGNN